MREICSVIAVLWVAGHDCRGATPDPPVLCGTGSAGGATPAFEGPPPAKLPVGVRSWEAIPSVIRNDGVDFFRLEVDANGPVLSVTVEIPASLRSESGAVLLSLHDDGQGYDRAAGDYIFTSEAVRSNPAWERRVPYYLSDSNSPPGVYWEDLGLPKIIDTDGSERRFTIWPQVGVLEPTIPATGVRQLSNSLQVSPHFMNLQTTNRVMQSTMKGLGADLRLVTAPLYASLPDMFDFLVCISSDHIDYVPAAGPNYFAGLHIDVKIDFTGTSRSFYDQTAYYGSAGRLKSFNFLDTGRRGVYANNCAHELIHLWAAGLDGSFGLTEDLFHYLPRSSIGSIVGGQLWDEPVPGKFFMNCAEGRNGAHRAAPVDKYFMGLVGPEAVPVMRAYSRSGPAPFFICNREITNIVTEVSIDQVVTMQGVRRPGPAEAQRDFRIGFVGESRESLFTATEMTFYEILAQWFTKDVSPGEPDPYIAENWVPIAMYFGENTKWRSRIDPVLELGPVQIRDSGAGQVQIHSTGFQD